MENDASIMKKDKRILLLCTCISVVIFTVDLVTPLGVAAGVPYIAVILLSLFSGRRKLPVQLGISSSLLTLLGFFLSPPGGEFWKVIVNRLLALFAIWTTAVLGMQRKAVLEEKEKALSEIRVLRGFLPICASCKKIRDDQGYWNQIESYIRDHSEAEFSHSVCPDCCNRLYPEINLSKKGNNPDENGS